MNDFLELYGTVQEKVRKLNEEIAVKEFEGISGDNGIRVIMYGNGLVKKLKIDPDAMNHYSIDILGDLIASAINAARYKSAKETLLVIN